MSFWPVEAKADLTPLVETPCTGLKKLGGLLFGKFTRAEDRRNILAAAQNQRDAQQITNGELVYVDGELRPALAPISPLIALGQHQDLENLTGNLKIALDILGNTPDESISETDVAPDWFARWRQGATVIGNTDMQALWGRILAEEIKTPTSFSYKTLDVLKNITKRDATIFSSVIPLRVGSVIPCTETEEIFETPYSEISKMIDVGLIMERKAIQTGKYDDDSSTSLFFGHKVTYKAPTIKNIHGSGIIWLSMSRAGFEISLISDAPEPSNAQLKYIISMFRLNNKNIHSFTSIDVVRNQETSNHTSDTIISHHPLR
ncbi:DUF2806 domain-containing protein [Nitratidesulfovibrio sp. D1]|uniref:DUF2806 domain-containing protein n=1 Tax=Nitratidesulfovibrio sp. D1 TaxID=3440151 RepID=UPI003EB9A2AD